MLSTWTCRVLLKNSQLIRYHSSFNLHLLQSASYFQLDSANIMIHVLSHYLLFQSHWILNMIHFLLIIILRSSSFSISISNFIKALFNLASLFRFLFYVYLRLFLLFYLVLLQAHDARLLYQFYIQFFIAQHEVNIDIFISHACNHVRAIDLHYLKWVMKFLKENLLRLQSIAQTFSSTSEDRSESE